MSSLKQRTVSSVKWLVINNVLQKVINVVAFAILARILQPRAFGLFAMAFIAIDGFSLFKSFGIDSALVQRKDNHLDVVRDTAFFLTQAVGFTIFILFQLAAPIAAHLLHNHDVLSIMRALSVVFIFGCLGRIPNALLSKQMRFELIATIDFVASVVNSVLAVVFALISPSVWSLVWAYLFKQITMASLSWYFERYHVKWKFDWKIAKELLHFGKFMVGIGLVGYLIYNLDDIVVGRILGAAALGYYALAFNISQFINAQFIAHVGKVMFPAYVQVQNDSETLKRAFLKTIRFVSVISIPFGMVLLSLAHELVLGIYGEKWLPIVPLIRLFGIVQMVNPLFGCSYPVFWACGKPNIAYRLNLLTLVIETPLLIFMTKFYGLVGTVVAMISLTVVVGPLSAMFVRRIVKFKFHEVLTQLIPSFASGTVMVITIFVFKNISALHHVLSSVTFHHLMPAAFFCLVAFLSYFIAFFFIDRSAVIEVKKMIFGFEQT